MSHERHRGGPPPSKPQHSPAISAAEVQTLRQRVDDLERKLKDAFDEKNQWNSEVRQWIDHKVSVLLLTNTHVVGVLRWMDRYTLCVDTTDYGICIVHKGAVALIRRV